jgi:hypothetical protein
MLPNKRVQPSALGAIVSAAAERQDVRQIWPTNHDGRRRVSGC